MIGSDMKEASATLAGRSERGRATREALLDAGERLLAWQGLEGMTSTAVAAEAGVATGTFYGYFPDKHALLAALFARRLDDVVARVERVLTSDRLLDDGLEATLRLAVEVVLAGYRAHAHVLRAALARVALRDDLRAIYWERHARAVAVVERFVARGQRARMVRDADPSLLAHTVLVVTQSLNHPVLLSGDVDLAAGVEAEIAWLLNALLDRR